MTLDFIFAGFWRDKGEFFFCSQGIPETSFSFSIDFREVSDTTELLAAWLLASVEMKNNEANSTR